MRKDLIQQTARTIKEQVGDVVLDADARFFSFGKGGAKNFLGEPVNPVTVSFAIENQTAQNAPVIIGNVARSIFPNETEAKTKLGAVAVLKDGVLFTDANGKEVIATSHDSGRTLLGFMKYVGSTPTRIVRMHINSEKIDGTPDTTNLTSSIKTAWASPFESSIEEADLPLRKFQNANQNSPNLAEVDFQKEMFPVVLSNETFFVLNVKPNTRLNVTFTVGAQLSLAQKTWRQAKAVDRTFRHMLINEKPSCGC